MLGLADLIVDTLGSGTIPYVQEQVAELITQRDTLWACLRAYEADETPNRWGYEPALPALRAGRTLFGRSLYTRMVEIIQLLGTSSLMALPAEADFDTDIAAKVDQYMATDTVNARDRAKLFHLAWDASCSAFRGRQVLYERMVGGNPVRNSLALFKNYGKDSFKQNVRDFLIFETLGPS